MQINTLQPQPASLKPNLPKQTATGAASIASNTMPDAYVSLSELGKAKSKQAEENKDIDDSNLPDIIKQMLKTIRDLKQQIAEKQAEIDKAKQDGLQSEQQQEKLKLLQTELSMLNSALSSAQQSLNKAMQQQELSDEQIQTALSLML
jgi:Sec-independent protein translocase protein TatA